MRFAWVIVAVLLSTAASLVEASEVLQSISDDNAVPSSVVSPSQTDHDRIIYRVSCRPEDEALPDCERSFNDHQPVLATPDFPQDAEESANADPQTSESPTATNEVVTSTPALSKATAKKKSAKSSSKSVKPKTKVKDKAKSKSTTAKSKASSKNPKKKSSAKSKS